MTKADRAKLIRERFHAKGGRLLQLKKAKPVVRFSRGFHRHQIKDTYEIKAWVRSPDKRPSTLLKERIGYKVSPLTKIALNWRKRLTAAQ